MSFVAIQEEIDYWAVQVVVREGCWMNLNRTERVLAAHLMQRKGMDYPSITDRLRVARDTVEGYLRHPPSRPVEQVLAEHPHIMGPSVPMHERSSHRTEKSLHRNVAARQRERERGFVRS